MKPFSFSEEEKKSLSRLGIDPKLINDIPELTKNIKHKYETFYDD